MKLLLLLLTTLKFGKLLTTGGTMILSLALYATIWGWPFAAGFVGLLFAHEMGHYVAARQRGIDVGAVAFIPFVGAFTAFRTAPRDAEANAYVTYAGPFVGTLAAFAVYFWARSEGSELGLAIAYSGFFLNLLSLLPVAPLDGGYITAVMGPQVWLIGAPLLLALLLWQPSPVLFLVVLLAVPQLLKAWRYDPNDPANRDYYNVGPRVRLEYMVLYFGLVAVLALVAYSLHTELRALHGG